MGGDTRATNKMRRPSQKPPSNGSHGDHKGDLQTCGGTYGNHNIYCAGGSWAGPGQGLQTFFFATCHPRIKLGPGRWEYL